MPRSLDIALTILFALLFFGLPIGYVIYLYAVNPNVRPLVNEAGTFMIPIFFMLATLLAIKVIKAVKNKKNQI